MRKFIGLFVVWVAVWMALASALRGADITPSGDKLGKHLDDMKVENFWLPKQIVKWKTGEKLKDPTDSKAHTHCSAFVAAACLKMDVYILRPPEHSTTLLANAQAQWLASPEAREKGWRPVASALEAQRLANTGTIVVAAFQEADAKKAGHVAIVRPSTKSEARVQSEGPQIVQAGQQNANSTTVEVGFRHHKGAWPGGLRFYSHEVMLK